MVDIAPGLLLISDPFLKDPNFTRTVVLICDHQVEGSFGFILNKLYHQTLNELVNDITDLKIPVFYGGPVQKDTLHFIHKRPDLIEGGMEIMDGIFWGGDFEIVINLLRDKAIKQTEIRFFIGYSGWGDGQLQQELATKNWITRNCTQRLVFYKNTDFLWKEALHDLGGEYAQMMNYPTDPQLN